MTKTDGIRTEGEADMTALPSLPFRVAAIAGRAATHVRFVPDAAARAAIAGLLDLLDLPQLGFDGEIVPSGKRDMVLKGRLKAVIVQACGITLDPVRTRLDERVERHYLADFVESEAEETEIPDDDTVEALPEVIDAAAVVIEALALALPLYPRAPGVELGRVAVAPPGAAPLKEADLKPFAGLGKLMGRTPDSGETDDTKD